MLSTDLLGTRVTLTSTIYGKYGGDAIAHPNDFAVIRAIFLEDSELHLVVQLESGALAPVLLGSVQVAT